VQWLGSARPVRRGELSCSTSPRLQAEGTWPRNSTLRKNRFHEKHLGEHGELDWSFVSGADWDEAAFAALAEVETKSWIAARTDGSDAKFTMPKGMAASGARLRRIR
jgi:hypothetical protein